MTRRIITHSDIARSVVFTLLGVIVAIETLGGGGFVYRTGTVHVMAAAFIALAVVKLLSRRIVSDSDFRMLGVMLLLAMVASSGSHIIHLFQGQHHGMYGGTGIPVTVAGNYYAVALALLTLGIYFTLSRAGKQVAWVGKAAKAALVAFLLATVVFQTGNADILFASPDLVPAYFLFVLGGMGLLAVTATYRAAVTIPVLEHFAKYAMIGIGLLVISGVLDAATETIVAVGGVPMYRVVNLSHYVLYFSLGLFYLGIDQLGSFGGVYKDIEREINEEKRAK